MSTEDLDLKIFDDLEPELFEKDAEYRRHALGFYRKNAEFAAKASKARLEEGSTEYGKRLFDWALEAKSALEALIARRNEIEKSSEKSFEMASDSYLSIENKAVWGGDRERRGVSHAQVTY